MRTDGLVGRCVGLQWTTRRLWSDFGGIPNHGCPCAMSVGKDSPVNIGIPGDLVYPCDLDISKC